MPIPLDTLAPTVDADGITIPSYADVYATLKAQYQSIFGSDVYLEPDSQDGQWLSIIAAAINDINASCVAVYNQFSPATAVGVGLSSVVKINGLARQIATASSVDVLIVGVAGTTINLGIVGDILNQRWALPDSVDIPPAGEITVTASALTVGALAAAPGTVTKILTPTLGWQTVNNLTAATPGAPVESDAALRQRQAKSTALSALTPLKALVGAVSTLTGVTQVQPYENDTNATDANGIPAHSIALVVEGGDAAAIAVAIKAKKTLGGGTYGNTSEMVDNGFGIPEEIQFSRPVLVDIGAEVTLTPLIGFTTAIQNAMKQAVTDYINALPIGEDVIVDRLSSPLNLYGAPESKTYKIAPNGVKLSKNGGALAAADVVIAFDELAACDIADISFVV
jgi:uncharacterized phage protein gp47/JayE